MIKGISGASERYSVISGFADFARRFEQQRFNHNFGNCVIADTADRTVPISSFGREIWRVGIIFLTIGVLSPLVSGKIQIPSLTAFMNLKMFAAVGIGILVAWIAGRGIPLMSAQPILVTGLLIGTIIGVAFLEGVPVGPLIAAGLLSFFAEKI